jgi:hypothetical protein
MLLDNDGMAFTQRPVVVNICLGRVQEGATLALQQAGVPLHNRAVSKAGQHRYVNAVSLAYT